MVCGQIIEERTVKYFDTAAHAINVLRDDGTRQAYVSLPFRIKKHKKKKTVMKHLKDLNQPYEYIVLKSETIKIKKNRLKKLLKRLLKKPDYGYIYWLKRLFRKRHTGLVFSEPNILYPVITEGAAIQQYFLYRGELTRGMRWN